MRFKTDGENVSTIRPAKVQVSSHGLFESYLRHCTTYGNYVASSTMVTVYRPQTAAVFA
jgi:hypothetical protein